MANRNESAANLALATRAHISALERDRWAAVLAAPTVRKINAARRASRLNKLVNGANLFTGLLPMVMVLGALAGFGGDVARFIFA